MMTDSMIRPARTKIANATASRTAVPNCHHGIEPFGASHLDAPWLGDILAAR
jgi:hypothetical protein